MHLISNKILYFQIPNVPLFRAAATAFSIDSILQSATTTASPTSTATSSPSPAAASIFSGLPSPLLPFHHFPVSCLPPFLPPPDLVPPLLPGLDRKHLQLKEQEEEARPPLALFPGVYPGYPGAEVGGAGGVAGGMLSQVLMSLSARHQRQVQGVKEEPGGGAGDHLLQEPALHHSPEISSTQGEHKH